MKSLPAPKSSRPATRRPFSVLLISALLVLEGLAVLAYAFSYALQLGQIGALGMGARIFMLVLIVAGGAWQLAVAHHFFRARAWTRAAALMWQIFQIILAIPYFQTDPVMAWLWLVPAALVVVLLFDPRTTAFLGDRPTAAGPPEN